jgi:hypothetical protein
MIRRILHGALWFKALMLLLILCGMPEKWAAITSASAVAVWAVVQIRDGLREQVWETPEHQAERIWTDMVWNNTRWSNGAETPEQGIERLAGPYRVKPRHHAPHELAMGGR